MRLYSSKSSTSSGTVFALMMLETSLRIDASAWMGFETVTCTFPALVGLVLGRRAARLEEIAGADGTAADVCFLRAIFGTSDVVLLLLLEGSIARALVDIDLKGALV